MTATEKQPLKPLYDILAQASKQQLPYHEAATLLAAAISEHTPPPSSATWDQTIQLAQTLRENPLLGMDHFAELCSVLTALTRQGLIDADHKYNCLKSATDITAHLLDDIIERLAELDGPKLTYLRESIAEHATQLADLFGNTPIKLTARVNALDDKVTAAVAELAQLKATLDAIDKRIDALADANNETVVSLAAHKADPDPHNP